MRTLLLVAHIAAAIVLIGPTTFAASVFPRYASPDGRVVAEAMHRVCRAYGGASLAVAAVGVALAAQGGFLTQGWVLASLASFAVAFALLVAVVVPRQARVLAAIIAGGEAAPADLSAMRTGSGLYGLIWLAILVLMVAKPF